MMNGRKTRITGGDDSDRKHLTGREVERLIEATRGGRNEARDRCLLLLMFRHGLRVSEAVGLKLDQVDTESRVLHVARLNGGLSTTHPLRSDELRAIKAWLAERAGLPLAVHPTPTCCGTHAALPRPTRGPTRGCSRITWGIGTFSIPSVTRRRTRRGLKGCGVDGATAYRVEERAGGDGSAHRRPEARNIAARMWGLNHEIAQR
jgi:type 1 fimbriae regulatory protein FimB